MKPKQHLSLSINQIEKYAIVNEKEVILERFRLKSTAIQSLPKLKNIYMDKNLKVVKL